jgi:hypothetical protein
MPGTAHCNRHVRFTPKSGDWRNQCRIRDGSADAAARYVAAFRKCFHETGLVEAQNLTVEYDWLEARSPAGAGGESADRWHAGRYRVSPEAVALCPPALFSLP